jgi:Zn-dependent protease
MKYSLKIGSAWGIPIELHITFILLIVAVFILSFLAVEFYLFYLIVLLFAFVVVHELSHSLVARHYRISVRKIVLYPIGGVSEIEEIPDNPRVEWRMAVSGPLSSLVIGAVFAGLALARGASPINIFSLDVSRNITADLARLNILLGAFNLLPAFPMDGGRVFRALLAEHLSFTDATRYAALVGRTFGILMAVFGIFVNYWLIIVGIFVYIGASEEAEQTIVSTTLAKVRVKDVMHSEVATVTPDTSLAEALEVMFKARYHDVLIEKEGALQGIVTWNEIMKVQPEQRVAKKIASLPIKQVSVSPTDSILDAYKIMTTEKIDLVPVVEEANPTKVTGVVTSEAIAYAYEKAKGSR